MATGPAGATTNANSRPGLLDEGLTEFPLEASKQDAQKSYRDRELAENTQSTFRRTTVLLGRAGVGKATIANVITGEETFRALKGVESMMREAKCQMEEKTVDGYHHHFLIFDTVAQQRPTVYDEQTMTMFKAELETKLKDAGVGLLVFVLRHGQETDMEIDAFRFIIDRLQNSVSECSALVVTGCEVLSEKAKETYRSKLYESDLTKHVAAFVPKDNIFLVSLPDIEELEDELKEKYGKKRDTSREELCSLIDQPPKRLWFPVELFKHDHEETQCTGARDELNDSTGQDSVGLMERFYRFVSRSCSIL